MLRDNRHIFPVAVVTQHYNNRALLVMVILQQLRIVNPYPFGKFSLAYRNQFNDLGQQVAEIAVENGGLPVQFLRRSYPGKSVTGFVPLPGAGIAAGGNTKSKYYRISNKAVAG